MKDFVQNLSPVERRNTPRDRRNATERARGGSINISKEFAVCMAFVGAAVVAGYLAIQYAKQSDAAALDLARRNIATMTNQPAVTETVETPYP